jgi:DNA polymerase III epsilon subunit-like protein
MNHSTIIVYDLETTSKNAYTAQPIQLAACAVDGRRLEIQDKFSSYIAPIFDEKKCKELKLAPLSQEVIDITKIQKNTLEKAPELRTVWTNFSNWVTTFNYKKTKWTAPIKCGFNNNGYDDIIIDRLCGHEPYKFGPWDDEYQKEALFNPVFNIDLMRLTWVWMENLPYVNSISMDSLRELMGMPNEAAHNAEFDVQQEAQLLIKYLKLHRHYAPKVKFKGAFANESKK